MAAIQNLNGVNNVPKKVSSKISFDIGDSFSGKIVSKDENGKGATVRTSDGWQFSAQIDDNIDQIPDKYVKFQVVGYEDGKLKLKIESSKQENSTDSEKFLENILKQNGLDKNSVPLLQKMAQFSIPLTRENISKIKTLVEFIDKLKGDSSEAKDFISKYMASRGILPTSEEGASIEESLNKFFKALNTLSLDDLLTLQENNIDITPENIKSYNNVIKGDQRVYNILENLKQSLNENSKQSNNGTVNLNAADNINVNEQELIKQFTEQLSNSSADINNNDIVEKDINANNLKNDININVQNNTINEKSEVDVVKNTMDGKITEDNFVNNKSIIKEINREETLYNKLAEVISDNINSDKASVSKTNPQSSIDNKNANTSTQNVEKDTIKLLLKKNDNLAEKLDNTVKQYIKENTGSNNKVDVSQNKELHSKLENIIRNDFKNVTNIKDQDLRDIIKILAQPYEKNALSESKNIKNQVKANLAQITANDVLKEVSEKNNSVKQIISELLKRYDDSKSLNSDSIVNMLKDNANDLKLFNDLSDKYYYMDVPLKFNEDDYSCKLIIKDDRKKGKKIDSTNVKIALSVATVNMGVVDAYVNVKDSNMNIELKCDPKWVKVFDMSKNKLASTLSGSIYAISIVVNEREKEMNIANCREFFSEGKNSSINVRV
ncbi:hypothetical protein [Clostridium oryzae]|uniref:Flagellar hook-length control protein FliK n=1 Tax=Clostridium oryzae TaxID=1450648 RepID=A0A1V4IJL7_9CLOT|nr:hypothetical protein [Clostridium oryzae]OPJ60099.1 hypothetical protein CLORY_29600 [Clostridium oryzae]